MRIVTYNTRGSLGMDNVRSTRRIAETVRRLAPDIVCFQEIHQGTPQSGGENQPTVLSQRLSRPFLFQRNLRIGFGYYGIGVAYRGTFVAAKEHLLPSVKEQRGALEVRLRDVSGIGSLTVFCTHWGLDADERVRQAEFLVPVIKDTRGPIVFCGDLNEGPEAKGVSLLLEQTGLMDSDRERNRNTFVSQNPTERIDYLLYSPELETRYVEVVDTRASDHCPLLVDLERVK